MAKKLITFFYPPKMDTFLRGIIDGVRDEYDVEEFSGGDEQHFYRLVHNSDICWFEWGSDMLVHIASLPNYSKYVARLHSFEFFEGIHHRVNWDKINALFLVSDGVKHIFRNGINGALGGVPETEEQAKQWGAPQLGASYLHMPDDKIHVVYNGINMDKYQIPNGKKFNKTISYVGYLNYKKAPELFLQACYEVWKRDKEFSFHIAGQFQDPRYVLYFNNLMDKAPFKVTFDGWQSDMPKYLEDKDFVISTSLFESFGYTIAEGMASGIYPLVHNWFGSDALYPEKFIWNSVSECADIVTSIASDTPENQQQLRLDCREFISNMYDEKKQIEKIKEVLASL